jgi:hypothetical protein
MGGYIKMHITGFVWLRIESLVTTAWRVLRLRMEDMISRYGGEL